MRGHNANATQYCNAAFWDSSGHPMAAAEPSIFNPTTTIRANNLCIVIPYRMSSRTCNSYDNCKNLDALRHEVSLRNSDTVRAGHRERTGPQVIRVGAMEELH